MAEISRADIRSRIGVVLWLLDPVIDAPKEARTLLLGQLLSSPLAIIMGSVNSSLVTAIGFFRHDGNIFAVFVTLELLMLTLRLMVMRYISHVKAAGKLPFVDLSILFSILWCALQGSFAFFIMQTGDTVLMVLSATLIMGIVGPICARNFSAPRLALLLVCLCDLPFKTGAVLSGDPWLFALVIMTPPFFLGAMQVILTFQKSLISTLQAEIRNNFLANHDALTGLLNRQGLDAALAGLLENNSRVAILGADLDGFKQANDEFGHLVGDKLLREVGVRLASSVRAGDLVARIGGDEFLIVIKGLPPEDVMHITERLIASVAEEPIEIDGIVVKVGVSIGYSCYPEDAKEIEQLRLFADSALYSVKRAVKGIAHRFIAFGETTGRPRIAETTDLVIEPTL